MISIKVDFPEPVLPIIPIFSPFNISKLIFLRTFFSLFLKVKLTFSKIIFLEKEVVFLVSLLFGLIILLMELNLFY